MKKIILLAGLVILLSPILATADTIISNCTANCTVTYNMNTSIVNVTTYELAVYNFSNVTILDGSALLNLTTTLANLQTNLTVCQNRVNNELAEIRNQTGYDFLVGKIQNQTLENAMLKTDISIMQLNISQYREGYTNFGLCMNERNMLQTRIDNMTITENNHYLINKNDFRNGMVMLALFAIAIYTQRTKIDEYIHKRSGEQGQGQRQA